MEIQDKMDAEALFLQNMDKQLNPDVLTEIFDFLPFKFKRYLNKELYIMGWKEMIIGRYKLFSPQTFYNYYKFIINSSNKHRCLFILDLIVKKRDLYMTGLWWAPGNIVWRWPSPGCKKYLLQFYKRYAEMSSPTLIHDKIRLFSNLLYDEKIEFYYLFKTKIWPEMKEHCGSLINDRYTIESDIEYSKWVAYDNKLDYLNSKCWLK